MARELPVHSNSFEASHRTRTFYSASFLLLTFQNLASGLHYVFQAMMAHVLTTADFGLMNALFSLIAFLSLPVGVYMSIFTRQWAELVNVSRDNEVDRQWYSLMITASGVCLVGVMIAWWFVPWMAWWLKTSNQIVVRLAIIGSGVGVVFGLTNPIVIARQWFGLLAVSSVAGAVLRIALGRMGVRLGFPLSGAVVATVVFSGILTLAVLWRSPWPGRQSLNFQGLLPAGKEWRSPALLMVSSFCICGADMLVVRRFYEPHQAGIFAQVMVLGRIIFFLVGPVATVILPKSAVSLQTNPSLQETKVVRRAFVLGLFLLMVSASIIYFAAPIGFRLLNGSSSSELVGYLRIAVWCLVPLSLCQLVIPSLFARREEKSLLEFSLLSLLIPLGLILFKGNLVCAFLVEGGVGMILLAFVVWRFRHILTRRGDPLSLAPNPDISSP